MTRKLRVLAICWLSVWLTACNGADPGGRPAQDTDLSEDVNPDLDLADLADLVADLDIEAGDVPDSGNGDAPAVDIGDQEGDEPEEPPPPLPHAACSMAPYDILPPDRMGEVIDWHNDPVFDLTPAVVRAMLSEYQDIGLPEIAYGCRVVHFRYRTQDRGQEVEATGVLGLPANAALPEEPMSFAVFMHGTTGFSDPCAPSRDPMDAPPQACLLAALGYVAVLPDYIGMVGGGDPSTVRHAYLVGEQAAIGSWDALRASERLLDDDLAGTVEVDRRVILWGGSQGGHAALYTELVGPYYAPEYEVPGVVAAVPPTDLVALARLGMESLSPPTEGLVAMLTANRLWYGAPEDLTGLFTNADPIYLAENAESIVYPDDTCDPGEGLTADSVDDLFLPTFIDAVLEERFDDIQPWTCYLAESSLVSTSVPRLRDTPTLVVYSENDDLVVTAPHRLAFDRLCEMGYILEYLECAGAGHSEGAVWSLPEQIAWINSRLAGEPLDSGAVCQRGAAVCCRGTPEGRCLLGE
ncbi:MAG: alpha/beta fold hydrolase [Bradymonadales bacterium]|nr:alpha/beta fold hydrolase [Bradymonadales bacterium]